ncbi:hypothetical protein LCGC14_1523860 [marine sediment metagenome]|uniref:Sporulation protein Cse60 n=2 Tax=root TaxID=1 RepID=A0A831QT29_9FLAO|nr:hypothetical protein [Pricia antarctica]
MIIKAFTSRENPLEAIDHANKTIDEMKKNGYHVNQIAQSESVYCSSFEESREFHFTLTVVFDK